MKTPYSNKSKISIYFALVRKETIREHSIIPIDKKSIFLVIFGIFFISIIFTNPAFAIEPECEWELRENTSVQVGQISYDDNEKTFANIQNQLPQVLELDCLLSEPTSLQNKLIDFDFLIISAQNYDLSLSVFDTAGNRIFNSAPIMKLYDVSQNQKAHVVLDPIDFGIDRSSISDKAQGLDEKINNLKLTLSSNDYESITISNSKITSVEDFPDFKFEDNLPIQSTIPGFLTLIIISFPLGFVLLSYSNFLKEENFFVKIPWFLGFGFCVYLVFVYLISQIWISFEIILGYVILELGIMMFYLKQKKIFFTSKPNLKSKKTIIFFSVVLLIAGTLSVNYVEAVGWPTGIWDSRIHVSIISLTVANNVIDDGKSLLPVSDIPGWSEFSQIPYPRGSHAAVAGLSFLTGTFPAVSMESTFGFIIFLIPVMLASIVYKFSKSIFLSSIMFIVIFWAPIRYPGDMMVAKIVTTNFAASIGILVALTCFMIFIAYFEKGHKLKLFIYFAITIFALAFSYYGFVVLPILIGLIGFLIYYIKDNKKRTLVFASLIAIFISMPLWSFTAHELVGLTQEIPYIHSRYGAHYPFNPDRELFPLWVSSVFGIICAGFLFINKRYRPLTIIVLLVSLFHLLPISHDLALYYGFFYKSLRSVDLMFFLSIAMNLIMFGFITKQVKLNPGRFFSKLIKNNFVKVAALGLLVLVLFPGFQIIENRIELLSDRSFCRQTGSCIDTFPSGNERNLQLWLYENVKPNELVLNDLSNAAQWYIGFKAQNLVNGHRQEEVIFKSYDFTEKKLNPTSEGAIRALRANEILKHPWDHDTIGEITKELDIKYIYISERERFQFRCYPFDKWPECYPNSENWPWKGYSGNSRIAMYDNHPNLELILRNGNSAIFKIEV